MTHTELIKDGLNDWALYFRRKLTDRVATMYLEKIQPYSEKTVKLLINTPMQELEPKPSNFPSLNYVRQFCGNIEEQQIEYDQVEDQRFPTGKLWESYRVLEKHGKDAFYNYCNTINMPLNDRERVIRKHQCSYNIKEVLDGMVSKKLP